MASVTFNTYEFIKKLEKAGLDEKKAEAITTGILQIHESADLVTKSDLREMELRMTIKLGSMLIAAIGVLSVIIKFF